MAATEYSVGDFDVVLAYPVKIRILSAREDCNQVYTRQFLVFCEGAVGQRSLIAGRLLLHTTKLDGRKF